jgi:ADP-ribose pyrophosphatase
VGVTEIPAHARCVFRGKFHDVYQWEVVNFEGEAVIFEALRRPDVVSILATDGEVLWLAREEQPGTRPFWTLFGGGVEPWEEPLEAARRELLEEAGMEAEGWELLLEYVHPGRVKYKTWFYAARGVRQVAAQRLDGGERIEVTPMAWERWLELVEGATIRGHELLRLWLCGQVHQERASELRARLFGG